MMSRIFKVLIAIFTLGCGPMAAINAMTPEQLHDYRKRTAGKVIDCSSFEPVGDLKAVVYSVKGCSREWVCRDVQLGGPPYLVTKCEETSASKEGIYRQVILDRLQLETGCAAEKISIISSSKWRSGTEQSYRLNACGKIYTCTHATGRTNCAHALNSDN
jgi:hypothetical protein